MELFVNIVIVLALSVAVLMLFNRLRIPTIVGFLLTGMIAGPTGFNFIGDPHQVEVLAEIGILLLLFTIGIELSLSKLLKAKRLVLLGGSMQVGVTIVVMAGLALLLNRPWQEALFLGFLFSLSSTAIVLNVLQKKNMLDAMYGRVSLGILIFQDIIIVPMMLVTPFLVIGSDIEMTSAEILRKLGIGVGLLVVLLLAARYVIPKLFELAARSRSNELFLVMVLVTCFAVAFLTNEAGLSLSLGAFLAGLVISESTYTHYALSSVLPLKTVFTSIFFVSVGMLLDLNFLVAHLPEVLIITVVVAILKALILLGVGRLLRLNLRHLLLTALALWQVGEFAFILSRTGMDLGILPNYDYQLFLAVSILTMGLTPFVLELAPGWVDRFMESKMARRMGGRRSLRDRHQDISSARKLNDHLIIIGYGLNGRNLARAARMADIPYVIIESNPVTVSEERQKKEPIFHGDATQDSVLHHASIETARVAVIAISDPLSTKRIVSTARLLNADLHIIVRSRYVHEVDELLSFGANDVVPEEFETAIAIYRQVLQKYLVPKQEIASFLDTLRSEQYAVLRENEPVATRLPIHLSELEVSEVTITDKCPWVGQTLEELALRRTHNVSVLGIVRDEELIDNPDGREIIEENDHMILLGKPDAIQKLPVRILE